MAQGYDNSIGDTFGRWADMTTEQRHAWWEYMGRRVEQDGILFDEATILYPRRWPNGNMPDEM